MSGRAAGWRIVIILAALYSIGAHGIMTLNDFKSVEGDRRMGIALAAGAARRRQRPRGSPAWSWPCRRWWWSRCCWLGTSDPRAVVAALLVRAVAA